MEPHLVTLAEKNLVGYRLVMSLSKNKTHELWGKFMPKRLEIKNTIGDDLYSVNVFESTYFNNFNPNVEFEKWAAIEVNVFDNVPDEMETFVLSGGLYAVFNYKGSSNDSQIFNFIYNEWLPK